MNRAMERLLNTSKADLNNAPDEEETGTPLTPREYNSLSEKMEARKEKELSERRRIADEEGETDVDQTDSRGLSDNEGDASAKTTSASEDDW